MAGTIGIEAIRIYKNAAGEVLRLDTITVSGHVYRENADVYGQATRIDSTTHMPDWGAWVFHPSGSGRRVVTELFHLGGARIVAEIELMGAFSSYDDTNFDWFEWSTGPTNHRVDLTDLPDIGDTV